MRPLLACICLAGLFSPPAHAEKFQFELKLGLSLCHLQNADKVVYCEGSGPLAKEVVAVDLLPSDGCEKNCSLFGAIFEKRYLLRWPDGNYTSNFEVTVHLMRLRQRTFILSVSVSPPGGSRKEIRSSTISLSSLGGVASFGAEGVAEPIAQDAAKEIAPTADISKLTILP